MLCVYTWEGYERYNERYICGRGLFGVPKTLQRRQNNVPTIKILVVNAIHRLY